jgi:uncharacterized protein (TIGR02231 family)
MWSALLTAALAATTNVDVGPSAVTVFASQARVTRAATVTLGAGDQTVAFRNIPPNADSSLFTADVRGGAELIGIEVRRVTAAEAADLRVKEIEDRLQDLQDRLQDLGDDEAAARLRLESATRARTAAVAQLGAELLYDTGGAAQARGLMTTLSAEDDAARDNLRAARAAKLTVEDEVAALVRERDSLGESATDTWTAFVRVDVARAGSVSVDLDYVVPGATWTPRYDLRGDGASADVSLALSASITQQTGEDWSNVRLSVSSAKPGRGTDVPTLDPFWLQPPMRYPTMSRAGAAPAPAAPRMMADADMGYAEMAAPMEVAQAEVEIALAATTFTVSRPEDVPGDGVSRKVLLTTEDLDAELRHVVVPRVDPAAYLLGEIENTADFPLLPGEAGVFVGDAYVGTMWVDTVPPGESFDVSFGPDDRVTVKRTRRVTETGEAGAPGRRATARWRWGIEVRSALSTATKVVVMEQVPVTTRDDVEVRHDVSTGGPTAEADDGGLLSFPLQVRAGGTASFEWGYTVAYPGELSLGWME